VSAWWVGGGDGVSEDKFRECIFNFHGESFNNYNYQNKTWGFKL